MLESRWHQIQVSNLQFTVISILSSKQNFFSDKTSTLKVTN